MHLSESSALTNLDININYTMWANIQYDVIKFSNLKLKPKLLKLLSWSGIRGAKLYLFTTFQLNSSHRFEISAFSISAGYGSAWHEAKVAFVEKYTLISRYFSLCKNIIIRKNTSVTVFLVWCRYNQLQIDKVSSRCLHYFSAAILED